MNTKTAISCFVAGSLMLTAYVTESNFSPDNSSPKIRKPPLTAKTSLQRSDAQSRYMNNNNPPLTTDPIILLILLINTRR
jgi:hypothetical protein